MENASKALIIAGAILLSIAIIGVGMYVFQNVQDTIQEGADMSADQIRTYNQEFTMYEGRQSGSQVRQLLDRVSNHHRTQGQYDPSKVITVVEGQATDPTPAPTAEDAATTANGEINTMKSSILSGRTYNVTFGYDADSGMLTQVGYQPAGAQT